MISLPADKGSRTRFVTIGERSEGEFPATTVTRRSRVACLLRSRVYMQASPHGWRRSVAQLG